MDGIVGILIAILAAFLIGLGGGWSMHNFLLIEETAAYQYQRGLDANRTVSVDDVRAICGQSAQQANQADGASTALQSK